MAKSDPGASLFVGIFVVIYFVLFLVFSFVFKMEFLASLFWSVIIGTALTIFAIVKLNSTRKSTKQDTTPQKTFLITPAVSNPRERTAQPAADQPFPGYSLAYSYTNRNIAMVDTLVSDYATIKPGDPIRFENEPGNEFDSKAIAIMHSTGKIGYVYRGQNHDMIHDFQKRGDKITAAISVVNPDEKTIFYDIAFYRPSELVKPRYGKLLAKARLIHSTGAEAQENIDLSQEGEEVFLDYDCEKDRIEVHALGFIGCLPKKLQDLPDSTVFVIDEIGESDNGKSFVILAAYES